MIPGYLYEIWSKDMSHNSNQFNRREVLKLMALGGSATVVPRWVFASGNATVNRDRVISIFLHGGADGLTVVPPLGDARYFDLRPNLAIPESEALALDGFYGLHPAATGLKSLYDEGTLAVIHAAGLDTAEHSHFSAHAAMEQGINPGDERTGTGWLGRYLSGIADAEPLAAIGIGAATPPSMIGASNALAVSSIDDFELKFDDGARSALADIYANDPLLDGTAQLVFDAVDDLAAVADIPPGEGYPEGELGHALSETARIIKSGSGLLVAGLGLGGWDHHNDQQRYMPGVLTELSQSVHAFREDIGGEWANTTVVVQTEFGRSAMENASGGTDHGHGGVMFAAGGNVNGGRVYGDWPGLGTGTSSGAGAEVDVTTDYRQVLSELLVQRLGVLTGGTIFPGFTPQALQGIFAPRV